MFVFFTNAKVSRSANSKIKAWGNLSGDELRHSTRDGVDAWEMLQNIAVVPCKSLGSQKYRFQLMVLSC